MSPRGGARPGAGRPPGRVKDAPLYVRIPTAELEAAKQAADDAHMTLSEWVRQAMIRMLEVNHEAI